MLFPIIIAETIYTLESVYKISKQETAKIVLLLMESNGIEVIERDLIYDALIRHKTKKVHFADAYLAACSTRSNTPVVSFDRDFDKFEDVECYPI